jgi:lipoprotein-anchoring transpeptidase ErfK/SrfK
VHASARRPDRKTGRTGWRGPIAAVAAIGLISALAACGSGITQTPAQAKANRQASAKAQAKQLASELKITPADGSKDADPATGISVTAAKGKVTKVTVHSSGDAITGTESSGDKTWHSQYSLDTATSYTVTATGTDAAGHTITTTSTFRTLTPKQTFTTEIFEGSGARYGVGMPIMLIFSQPITNRAAVERSLELTTSKPVVGSWYWDDSEHLNFRPREYWPANTTVSFNGHLNGVEGASGVYADANLTQSFNIGDSVIAVASSSSHRTQIYINGKMTYDWPISLGKPTTPTPNGTYVSVEKANPEHMIGGGAPGTAGYYNEEVPWSVRFTFSGDFYHDAYWSVSQQGTDNVSHGCVNLSPADAETYYKLSVPGDPITITNSTGAGKWDDGWTEWFDTWQQYLSGSALHEAVQAGPSGSTFVTPSTLAATTGTSPLSTSSPNNYAA